MPCTVESSGPHGPQPSLDPMLPSWETLKIPDIFAFLSPEESKSKVKSPDFRPVSGCFPQRSRHIYLLIAPPG